MANSRGVGRLAMLSLTVLGLLAVAATCRPVSFAGLRYGLMAAVVVVLVPGLAAVAWAVRCVRTSASGTPGGPDLAAKIAVAYGGVGIACIALWLAAAALGMSGRTSIGAPLVGAAVVALGAWLGRRRSSAARAATAVADTTARAVDSPRRTGAALLALSLLGVSLVAIPFATYGWERADGIHRMALTDWEKHLRMATAVAASPVFPPPHPYIHSDPNPSYYFGYHLVAAAIASVGGQSTDVFAALWLLTIVTTAAAPVVVYTFSKDLCDSKHALLAAAASTLLVGFDAVPLALESVKATVARWPLPAGLAGLRAVIPSTHIDFWIANVDRQFSAPIVSTMWAPHQTAATLIALLVLYLLAPQADDPARPRSSWLLPSLLIAALPGLSTYVALGLGVGVASAALVEAFSTRRAPWSTTVFRRWAVPGVVGFALALPIYPTVAHGSSSGLVFYVSTAGTWSNGAIFSWWFGPHQWTNLLDTPAVFLVDFGIIGLLGSLQIARLQRTGRLTPAQLQAATVALAIMLLVTFVRPPVGIGNNLYARALLLAWFLLAPFAAMAVDNIAKPRWLAAAVLVCALGTCYAEVGYLLEGGLFWATPKASVEALRWINDHTVPSTVVAIKPTDSESNVGYWLERPVVLGGRRLALLFGADAQHYDRTSASLEEAFAATDPAVAVRSFDALEADVILVRHADTDPVWAATPCFDVAHRNPAWTVVRRNRSACAPAAMPAGAGR